MLYSDIHIILCMLLVSGCTHIAHRFPWQYLMFGLDNLEYMLMITEISCLFINVTEADEYS
jgi:hypothetical protein